MKGFSLLTFLVVLALLVAAVSFFTGCTPKVESTVDSGKQVTGAQLEAERVAVTSQIEAERATLAQQLAQAERAYQGDVSNLAAAVLALKAKADAYKIRFDLAVAEYNEKLELRQEIAGLGLQTANEVAAGGVPIAGIIGGVLGAGGLLSSWLDRRKLKKYDDAMKLLEEPGDPAVKTAIQAKAAAGAL